MRYASVTDRLSGLGGAKWDVHARARRLKAEGRDIIELTIGEPDVPTPPQLMEAAAQSMQQGRTGWALATAAAHLLGSVAMTLLGLATVAVLRPSAG